MATFWDRIAGLYDTVELTNGKVYREMCAITRRLVPDGAKVLDCAAGTGELSFAAAVRADSVLCTDISENMLKNAKKRRRRAIRTTFPSPRETSSICRKRTKHTMLLSRETFFI